MNQLDPNIMSIIAVIVAILSFIAASVSAFFTARQSFLIRKHNRLSVEPHIAVRDENNKLGNYYIISKYIENAGVGLAIIKHYSFFYNGENLGSNRDIKSLQKAVENKINETISTKCHTKIIFPAYEKNFTCPVEKKLPLLEIEIRTFLGAPTDAYFDFVKKIDMQITYADQYKNKFTYPTELP